MVSEEFGSAVRHDVPPRRIAGVPLVSTNDQLRPSPPQRAKPRYHLSPIGTIGTQQVALSPDALERTAELKRKVAAEKQRQEALRAAGGLKREFRHNL